LKTITKAAASASAISARAPRGRRQKSATTPIAIQTMGRGNHRDS
jgi:hypothetical protein